MTANSLPLLARQPILDKSLRVTAYELLCRPVPSESLQWQQQSGNEATTEVVIGALHEVGMEAVTGGLPAFVNFTQEWLTRTPPLPPKQMVIELLEHIPIPEDTITNAAFGGPDLRTLYVTAGKTLFSIRTDVTGTRR